METLPFGAYPLSDLVVYDLNTHRPIYNEDTADNENSPKAVSAHTVVYTGTSMIVYGGFQVNFDMTMHLRTPVYQYNLDTRVWSIRSDDPAMVGRAYHVAVIFL